MRFLTSAILFLIFISASAQGKWKYDFIVPDNGNFVSAIKAANDRADKTKRFRIFIREGNYRIRGEGNTISTVEKGRKVEFPSPMTILTAPNTSIIGEEWQSTQIENCPQHEGISITSTLFLKGADSTYIQDVELWSNFRNDPNAFTNSAVALSEERCRGNILKNVSLLSMRNTYHTNGGGTTYLEDCTVKGTVDFICGDGTVFFNHCDIGLRPNGNADARDIVCAPSTTSGSRFGYVFNDCHINGPESQEGLYVLARPWKNAPRAVFINTVMHTVPAAEGFCEMNGTVPMLFAEYESMDEMFSLIDISHRRTAFRDSSGAERQVGYNTVLTGEQAEDCMTDKVFPGWNPQEFAAQVCPPQIRLSGRVITWEDVPGAGCYAVCRDRKVITFTTSPRFVIPPKTYEGACFSIRCANHLGGLGERSNEVVFPQR